MARSLGLPAIVGMSGALIVPSAGATAVIDGAEGKVILNPTAETLASIAASAPNSCAARHLHRLRKVPASPATGRDQPAGQSRTAGRDRWRPGRRRRRDRPAAHRIPLHEPRRLARARTSSKLCCRLVPAPGRPAADHPDPRRRRRQDADARSGSAMAPIRRSACAPSGCRSGAPELLETQLAAILRAGAHGRCDLAADDLARWKNCWRCARS